MTIESVLRDKVSDHSHVRLTCGDKWLVWYEDSWQVMHNPYRAKKVRTLIVTDDLDEALRTLLYN